jgi:hypothetical protein
MPTHYVPIKKPEKNCYGSGTGACKRMYIKQITNFVHLRITEKNIVIVTVYFFFDDIF